MSLPLRSRARHKPSGIEGRVIGIWQDLSSTQANLEYLDANGSLNREWFVEVELEAIDTAT